MIGSEKPQVVGVQSYEAEQRGDVAKPSVCERLDSWKEIACYLQRSIRCVQRWERKKGLPILRHAHAKGSSVYAFRQELDRWWHGTKNVTSDLPDARREKSTFLGIAEYRRRSRRITARSVFSSNPTTLARRYILQRPAWRRSWRRG